MKIQFYLDEDSSDADLLKALRLRNVNVESAPECGMRSQSDEAQLAWATDRNRVLLSANRGDFYEIHTRLMRKGKAHAGIVLVKQHTYSVGELLRRLLVLISSLTAEEMRNRVEFLSNWGNERN